VCFSVHANHTTSLIPNGGCTAAGVLSAEVSPKTGVRVGTTLTHTDSVRSNDGGGAGSSAAPVPSYSKRAAPSREVTFLLITVVLVAVFCQTPLAVFHFVRYAYEYHCGDTVFYLESSSKFLVNLNSCINFVLYCLLSPKFRRMLSDLLTCRKNGLGRRGAGVGGATSVNQRLQFEFSVRESGRRRRT